MTVKLFKVVYALMHILLIKEVMNPSDYIILILSIYVALAVVLNIIHIKEQDVESLKYINRRI